MFRLALPLLGLDSWNQGEPFAVALLLSREGHELSLPVVLQDISLLGMHRMLRANSSSIAAETFQGTKHGQILGRLLEYFGEGLAEVEARDPK